MVLLEARQLHFSVGTRILYDELELTINDNDHIGLIGTNGVGKSTLLRQLAEKDTHSGGQFTTSNTLVCEYLPQDQAMDENRTIIEQIFYGQSPLLQVVRAYLDAVEALSHESNELNTKKLLEAQEQMDSLDAWQMESNAKSILHRLGIDDVYQKIGTLSGGMRKRVALAAALIRPANLLLLDEPTNHLDYETITWLENLLKERNCAFVIVTHDRTFIDRTCDTIIELDQGQLKRYQGNYTTFLETKAIATAQEARHQEKLRRLYKQELEWMRKGVEARRTKQKARKERFYELEDQLTSTENTNLDMQFISERLGRKIINLENLGKHYATQTIIKNFSYAMVRTDRIGIVGGNGMGKTTLLNILAGLTTYDSGNLEIGETVKIGYYKQGNQDLPLEQKVIDFIKDHGEYIHRADGSHLSASQMLEAFLFRPDQKYAPIANLSGGERRRLYLLSILMERNNVLFLDEPTNDLDIGTLQVLEDFIQHFPGPVITVSHDRYFLDRIVNKIFAFEGNGILKEYVGDFSSYLEKMPEPIKKDASTKKEASTKPKTTPKLKLSYKEEQEYAHIEEDIAELEAQLSNLEIAMAQAATDYPRLLQLTDEQKALQAQLEEKLERWAYLEDKLEQIAQFSN